MSKPWPSAVLISTLFATIPDAALACTCLPPPPQSGAFAEAELVFRGKVLYATPGGDFWVNVGFQVDQVWKGPVDLLKELRTTSNSAACGYGFQVGREYVIYVSDGQSGTVTLCDRVRPVEEAANDLGALGVGSAPVAATLPDAIRHASIAGSWFNPARNGEGLVIEVLEGGRGVVYWFGYRPEDPMAQSWLSGVGQFVDGRLAVDTMLQPRGGGFGSSYDPRGVQLVNWGSLTVDVHADGTAHAQWNSVLPGYGRGELTLQRLTLPPTLRPAP